MKMPKKVTTEDLARIMAKGFEDTATKADLKSLATKSELAEIKQDLEEIKLKSMRISVIKYVIRNS